MTRMSLPRLGDHRAGAGQHPVDGGAGQRDQVMVGEASADGVCPGVEAGLGEWLAQSQDEFGDCRGGGIRGGARGRRDRGSNAACPSAAYRAMSRLIQLWETPQVRAASDWEDPARTRRRLETGHDRSRGSYADVLRHPIPMSIQFGNWAAPMNVAADWENMISQRWKIISGEGYTGLGQVGIRRRLPCRAPSR
jgi:hypothetical protein